MGHTMPGNAPRENMDKTMAKHHTSMLIIMGLVVVAIVALYFLVLNK
jgi:hypothetical protein